MNLLVLLLGTLLSPVTQTIRLEPGRTTYLLTEDNIVEGTLVVDSVAGAWELRDGMLYLSQTPQETTYVSVRYMNLNQVDSYRTYHPTYQSRFASADTTTVKPPVLDREELQVHGAKTFAVSVGTGGITDVNQGLVVDVSGRLREVNLDAHITDEEGTFVPQGTTQRIEDFDRIRIGLSQEGWELNLGDLDMSHRLVGYGTIDRRMTGISAGIRGDNISSSGAFGIEGTRSAHQVLEIEDGKRGPYWIGDQNSLQPVVPGSERIYLDGELLKRGFPNDYTIDYSTGEITFTPRTSIDASSHVEVDYSYFGSDYRADNELASFRWGPLDAFFYREADSRTHLYHTWSAQQQVILDTASGNLAVLPGARFTGEGEGSYLLSDSHYVWVGAGAGDYEVSFRKVDHNEGDYALDADSGFFRFVGSDSGDYRAEIETTLPERQEALGISFNRILGPFEVMMTGTGSRTTPNLYNNTNQRYGHSHKIAAAYNVELGRKARSFSVTATHRIQTGEAWMPAQGEDTDAADRWNLDSLFSQFNEQELAFSITPLDSLSVQLKGGHLWTDVHNYRTELRSQAPFFNLRTDILSGGRERINAQLHPPIGIFTPLAGARFENYHHTLSRSIEPTLGLRVKPLSQLTVEAKASRRIDQLDTEGWTDTLYYDRLGAWGDWEGDKLNLSATGGIERYTPVSDSVAGWQAWFAEVRTDYSPSSKLRLTADLSQALSREQSLIVEYVPVEPGSGDFSRDPETGEYVSSDPPGSGDYEQVTRIVEGDRLELERWGNLGVSLNLNLLRFRGSVAYTDASSSTSLLATARINILPRENLLNIIVEPSYRDQLLPSWGASTEHLLAWKLGGELRSRLHPDYLLRLEGSVDDEYRQRGAAPLRTRRNQEIELSPIFDIWLAVEPVIGFGTLVASEPFYYPSLGQFSVRRLWTGSDVEKKFNNLRLRAGILLTQRQPSLDPDLLPYLISVDDPAGLTISWHTEAEQSFKSGLAIRLQYEGDLYPDDRGVVNRFELGAGLYF